MTPRGFAVVEVLDHWTPGTVALEGTIDPGRAHRLGTLLGLPAPSEGQALSPMWHEVFLREQHDAASLGADGHPHSSELVPPIDRRQRLFAGGSIDVRRPLRVGRVVTRTARVESTRLTESKGEPMLLVTERHAWFEAGEVCWDERRTLAYRALPEPSPGAPTETETAGAETDGFVATPDLLSEFSALTANAHKIHVDRAWATGVEGHDDLLVHGPLVALLAAHQGERALGRPIESFTYRLTAPTIAGSPLTFDTDAGDGARVTIRGVSRGATVIEAGAE